MFNKTIGIYPQALTRHFKRILNQKKTKCHQQHQRIQAIINLRAPIEPHNAREPKDVETQRSRNPTLRKPINT